MLVAVLLAGAQGCKPSAPPVAGQNQAQQEPAAPSPADARHRPEADDLARFLRGQIPSQIKLLELKNDPPVSLPGASTGSNAWLYNVRVVFAPAEDLLGVPAPQAAAAFQSAVDELNALAAWSEAYSRSPYTARYPGFTVEPPVPARPKLLAVLHAKDRPYAPLYGKMSAEWQVDHWNYAVQSLQPPADDEGGKPRSEYPSPVLIQGGPETERFLAQVNAGLAAARPKKAAIDAAYHADLLKATRPGVTYKGQLVHGKNSLPAEARFLAAAPGDEPNAVRMEFRLFNPNYVYLCLARLAASPPVPPPAAPSREADDRSTLPADGGKPAPKADLAVGYLGVTDPKFDSVYSSSSDFRSATMSQGVDSNFWLSVQNHHLQGSMTLYDFKPPYFFDGQEVP